VVQPRLRPGWRLTTTTIRPERGDILGAGGVALVKPRPVIRFGIDKTHVRPAGLATSSRRLAHLLGIDPGSFLKRVRAAGPKAFVEGIVFRRQEVPARVLRGYVGIRGAVGISDHLPLAPTRQFAAAILGTVAAWAAVRYAIGMEWSFAPLPALIAILATMAATGAFGAAAAWRLLAVPAARLLAADSA